MTTWAQLQTDVAAWSARTDLSSRLSTMTALFEGRVNRTKRLRPMEASFSGTITDSVIALPADFLSFKRLWPAGYPKNYLYPQTLDLVRSNPEGIPTLYAVDGASNVRFNGTGDIEGVYYQAIPSLSANGYNWLSTNCYEAYLFGVLAEVDIYTKDDPTVNLTRMAAALDSLEASDQRLSGPLVARAV